MPYRLVHVHGSIEPELLKGEAADWDRLEPLILRAMGGPDYDDDSDLFFFIEMDNKGRLVEMGSFSGGFMDELRAKTRSPKSWRPKRRE